MSEHPSTYYTEEVLASLHEQFTLAKEMAYYGGFAGAEHSRKAFHLRLAMRHVAFMLCTPEQREIMLQYHTTQERLEEVLDKLIEYKLKFAEGEKG